MPSADAAREVVRQAVDALPADLDTGVLPEYEPFWAISADRPASPAYVAEVVAQVRAAVGLQWPGLRVVYGGSAGPEGRSRGRAGVCRARPAWVSGPCGDRNVTLRYPSDR